MARRSRRYGLMGTALLVGTALLAGGTVLHPRSRATTPESRMHDVGTAAGPILRTVTVGVQPIDIQLDEQTGRAFVLTNGDNSVSVLDTRTGVLLGTVPLKPLHSGPVAAAMTVDPRAGRVVIMNWDKSVSVLDAHSGRLLYTVPSGGASQQVVVDTRSGRIFVSNWGDFVPSARQPDVDVFKGGNTITVIDTRTGRHVGTIHGHGNPYAMAVDERTGRVFVKSDGGPMPGHIKLVSMLDGTTGRLLRTVVVGREPPGRNPSQGSGGIVVDERSGRVFVTTPFGDSVSVLDARSGCLVRTIGSGSFPLQMAVDERSGRVLVANIGSGTVSVLDATSGRLVRTVTPLGKCVPNAISADLM